MERFNALKFEPHPNHGFGVQAKMQFPNGYTASVIRGRCSYGGDDGLYELAVMHDGELIYDTPVTSDVEGFCSEERIDNLLGQILDLLPRNTED